MIPQEIIDQILDRTDIAEVLASYIQLKKSGRNFKACCPFHNEKTASFVVSPDKQIYHCFGCGAGGNVVNFIMKYENMDFPETINMLADKCGVEVPQFKAEKGEGPSTTSRLYKINELAASFYHEHLKGPKGAGALKYLKDRGFTSETLSDFKVGYAPNEWESFRKFCESKKIPADIVVKAGLTIPSEKGKRDYDRFRNRIIFPIFNERGKVVAFGGRVLDDSLPKYINSPETVIYSKSNVLYGMNFSKKGIREKGYASIVEGYMDVIVPFQHGVTNVVATSGTALTSRQAEIMKKYTNTAVMIFDSDQAGVSASLRGLDVLIENGINVRIVTLPKGEDPDSFVRKNGRDKFENFISGAKDLFDYKLDLMIKKLGPRDIGGIVDEMLPTLAKIENEVVKSDYLKKLSERLGVHEQSMRYEMKKVKPDYSYHYRSETPEKKSPKIYRNSEIHLLGMAITDKRYFDRIKNELGLEMLKDQNVRKAMDIVGSFFDRSEDTINAGKILSRLEEDEDTKEAVVRALAKAEITQDMDRALEECVFCVRKEDWEHHYKELAARLKKAQKDKDGNEVDRLVIKIDKIIKEKVV